MTHVDDGQLNALLDGELSADETRLVRSHLAACPTCRDRLEEARRFLEEAGGLLNLLDLPVAAASVATPAAAAAAPPVGPRRSVMKTLKERAIPVSRTVEEPALPADLGESDAARPIFARGAAPAPARRWPVRELAWAATVVLALSIGYLAGDLRRPSRGTSDIAAVPEARAPDADVGAAAPAPARSAAATGRASVPAAARPAGPPAAGGGTGERAAKPAHRPGQKTLPTEGAPGVLASPTVRRDQEVAGLAAADEQRRAPAAARQPPPPSGAPVGHAQAPAAPSPAAAGVARAAEAAGAARPPAFWRITLDDAVRRLSGSIRLVDGLPPVRVEVGPGHLVAGATPDREVVRVHYSGPGGAAVLLDQQPGDGPAPVSVNGLMPGDTLVTTAPDGTAQVRWLDRKGFWLSLSGRVEAESLRVLMGRIR
jgi:hypothetical protein